MPEYLFSHPSTGEVHTVVFRMTEDKVYRGPSGKGKPWKRVWTKPQMAVDSVAIDPYSAADYVKATNKKGDVGSLWDRSKELSLKRAEKEGGTDPVRQQFYEGYSKRRHGKLHPEDQREKSKKELAKSGIKVDWGDED